MSVGLSRVSPSSHAAPVSPLLRKLGAARHSLARARAAAKHNHFNIAHGRMGWGPRMTAIKRQKSLLAHVKMLSARVALLKQQLHIA